MANAHELSNLFNSFRHVNAFLEVHNDPRYSSWICRMASYDPIHSRRYGDKNDIVLIVSAKALALCRELPNYQYRQMINADFFPHRILSAEKLVHNCAPK